LSIIGQILSNKAIVVPFTAWIVAQLLKVAIVSFQDRKLDFTRLVGSGGMPSAHTAFIIALAAVTGKNNGWDSAEFAITAVFSAIVMYDAAGVRRAAGKQAEVLNKLLYSNGHIKLEEKLKELIGHTPFEVIIGAVLGALFGYIFG